MTGILCHPQQRNMLVEKQARVVVSQPPGSPTFVFDRAALEEVLLRPDVKDLPVAVISVAGAFRKGKSFLLGFLIRYLESLGSTGDWLEGNGEPVRGFSWRYGADKETRGIQIWSEVFKVKNEAGQQMAVVLMDTEGTFDDESTTEGNVTVFSLSILTSSVQVYNISGQIQQNDLQHLKLFAEYGRMALKSQEAQSSDVFQKLVFLVRDWQYPEDYSYGYGGGNAMLQLKWFSASEHIKPEVRELREAIRSTFREMKCFLMPHPGMEVARSKAYDGRPSGIAPEFKTQLHVLVPDLVDPEILEPKRINGKEVTCKELVDYFQIYFETFRSGKLPKAQDVFDATAFIHNRNKVWEAVKYYCNEMDKFLEAKKPYAEDAALASVHQEMEKECRGIIRTSCMMGRKLDEWYKMVDKEMERKYKKYVKRNKKAKELEKAIQAKVEHARKEEEKKRLEYELEMEKAAIAKEEEARRALEEERQRYEAEKAELEKKKMEEAAKAIEEARRQHELSLKKMEEEKEREKRDLLAEIQRKEQEAKLARVKQLASAIAREEAIAKYGVEMEKFLDPYSLPSSEKQFRRIHDDKVQEVWDCFREVFMARAGCEADECYFDELKPKLEELYEQYAQRCAKIWENLFFGIPVDDYPVVLRQVSWIGNKIANAYHKICGSSWRN